MLTPWYAKYGIEPPFPWLGLAIGVGIAAVLTPLAFWAAFELIDQNLESYTP